MAGKLPGLVTGANAKIMLDITVDGAPQSLVMAYANDLTYSVDTVTVPVEVIGRFELLTNEPVAHGVSGSFSVVRYTTLIADSGLDSVDGSDKLGNSAVALGLGNHFNPQKILQSSTFDIQVYQKTSRTGGDTTNQFFKLVDCRATNRSSTLNKRGVMIDTYRFVGILSSDGDIPTTDTSGNSGTT